MSIRIIRTGNDAVLRQRAKDVPQISPAILKLLDDMAQTMYDAEGIGLAANQIGIAKRLVVVNVGTGLIELINPVILEKSGSQLASEGCLSLPGISGKVVRAKQVRVEALNRHGEIIHIDADDLLSRCIQHEVDHLDGILFTDYLKPSEIEYVKEGKESSDA